MSENTSAPGLGLLSLPVEVLRLIAEKLSPRDLLALSEVCGYLRSIYNVNSIWRKHTDGVQISQGLDRIVSLVEPQFMNPCITSLEPLCEYRLHFLKQSRLLSNMRQGKFVQHSIEFHGFLSDFETMKPINNRQVTYNSKFLFTVDFESDLEVIKVFDIDIFPTLILTVNLKNHAARYCVVTWVHVIRDTLIVRRDDWVDIYAIKLPEALKILCSIDIDKFRTEGINQTLVINRFLFVENDSLNVVQIWDLYTGKQCTDLSPRTKGPDFKILGYSQNEQLVVLAAGMSLQEPSDPCVFIYDVEQQDFTLFNPVLNKTDFKCHECYGLIDSNYVVLLNERRGLNFSVFVFDYSKSTLLAKKTNLVTRRIEDAKIIDGYLVLPSLVSVVVMSMKSLETLWELQLDTARSLVYEFPRISMEGMEVFHISSMCSIIVIHKVCGVEMWDFRTRSKFLDIPLKGNMVMNDISSKLIFCNFDSLIVLSFW